MSCNEHDTKKYCWRSLRIFPFSVLSFGYKTFEIVSPIAFSWTAWAYPPSLNAPRSNSFDARDSHNLRKFTVFAPNPTTGMSHGTPTISFVPSQDGNQSPVSDMRFTTRPPIRTFTVYSGRTISHGQPNLSQLSGDSTCLPFSKDCVKRPNSYRMP